MQVEASEGKRQGLAAMRATAKQQQQQEQEFIDKEREEEQKVVSARPGKRQALGSMRVAAKLARDSDDEGSESQWGRHTDNADRALRGIESRGGESYRYSGLQRPGRVSVHDPQPW